MIDIIIPAYNANETITKTLFSIVNQVNSKDISVTIVDDCSKENYDTICALFSNYVKIKIIRLDHNSGPGIARQCGIDNTNNPYIIFIDADDVFYDDYAVLNLYEAIKDADMASGKIYYQKENKKMYFDRCLHGKIYRRSFLQENNIRFNTCRNHEDNAFNTLCTCICKKNNLVDQSKTIYVYYDNLKSITNSIKIEESMHNYIKSVNWIFENVEKSSHKNYEIIASTLSEYVHCLFSFYIVDSKKFGFMIEDSSFIKKEFLKYLEYLDKEKKDNLKYEIYKINDKTIYFYDLLDKIKD